MSMMPPDNRSFLQRWRQFWFAPGDPTTLGFIRIVTGLLVLYTHLAYSLDLQGFFGKYSWFGSAYMERERKEQPNPISPFWAWDESNDADAMLPEAPHRRAAVLKFIRGLPASEGERRRSVNYLAKVADETNPFTSRVSLDLVYRLYGAGDLQRETVLVQGLDPGKQWYRIEREGRVEYVAEKPDELKQESIFPEALLTLPKEARTSLVADLRALMPVLPKDSASTQFVIAHLVDLNRAHRKAFVEFLVTLPEDPVEREKLIDYLDYWNSDRRKSASHGIGFVSIWFHVTEPWEMNAVHGTILVIIVLFTVGFCTRVTSVLVWFATMSYLHRTNQVLFGMDTMMNILIIYLMIGNSAAALSVDRLIARYRAARASIRRSGTIDEPTRAFLTQAPPSVGANFGIRLIQVHFCFIYLASGLSKLKGDGWWNGTAFWDVMINPEFTLIKYQWFENMVRAMASIKPLYYATTMFGVWFTWGLEISLPFLVWTRLRPLVVWLSVLLHAGIGMLMGLNVFELYMMTMLLVFFPPGVIRDRLRGSGTPKLAYGFDPAAPDQARAAALVAAADIDSQVSFENGKKPNPPVQSLFGTLRLLNVLSFLLWVPGVSGCMAKWLTPASPKS